MKTWERLGLGIGVILALAASLLAFQAQRISESVVRECRTLERQAAADLRIELQPASSPEIRGATMPLRGRLETSAPRDGASKAVVALRRLDARLVVAVRPVVQPTEWWIQPPPTLLADGNFEGSVAVGDEQGAGVGLEFEIVVIAVAQDGVVAGDRLPDLPIAYASSRVVRVHRIL